MKEFADDNFKFDEDGRQLSKWVENTVGKRRNCSLRAISPFPTVFSKGLFPRGVKRCQCVGMGKQKFFLAWVENIILCAAGLSDQAADIVKSDLHLDLHDLPLCFLQWSK